jgi:zinc transporter 9
VKTPEELETFMLKHGENIIDTLGAEVDRLEKELKVSMFVKINVVITSIF